jgi:HSP20 family protein
MFGLARRGNEVPLARPTGPEMLLWEPWPEFERLRAEMDRLFGGVMSAPKDWPAEGKAFMPTVDLYETENELVMNAYLPGLSPEDIHLEVLGDTLRLTGETKSNVPEKEVTVHRAEGAYGRFDLRYTLPVEVKAEECRATYRNGMLEVHMPKVEIAKPTPVEVRVEG